MASPPRRGFLSLYLFSFFHLSPSCHSNHHTCCCQKSRPDCRQILISCFHRAAPYRVLGILFRTQVRRNRAALRSGGLSRFFSWSSRLRRHLHVINPLFFPIRNCHQRRTNNSIVVPRLNQEIFALSQPCELCFSFTVCGAFAVRLDLPVSLSLCSFTISRQA